MIENKMRCPHCGRCIGVFVASDGKNSTAKVFKSKPTQIGLKQHIFETQCPRCKEIISVIMGFEN